MQIQRLLLWLVFAVGSTPTSTAADNATGKAAGAAVASTPSPTNSTAVTSASLPQTTPKNRVVNLTQPPPTSPPTTSAAQVAAPESTSAGKGAVLPKTGGSPTTNASPPQTTPKNNVVNLTQPPVTSPTPTKLPAKRTPTTSAAQVAAPANTSAGKGAVLPTTRPAPAPPGPAPPLTTAPASEPPLTPAPATQCSDVYGWKDLEGASCSDYVADRKCTPTGDYGRGWNYPLGTTFDSFQTNGLTALVACCGCGGGSKGTVSESSSMWQVLKGSCTVDTEGCLTSPNFPSNYGTSQNCKVFVNREKAKPISAVSFATEAQFDILAINGQRYSGTNGPKLVTPQGTIVWTSDSIDRGSGWRLCPARPRETPPPGYSGFWVTSGLCSIDGTGCAVSPNYPQPYGHDQACRIEAINMINPTITPRSFLTEMTYDYMQVNGLKFSGTEGPKNLPVNGPITWSSDYATVKSGWIVCKGAVSAPAVHNTGATAAGRGSSSGTVAPIRGDTSGGMFMWVAAALGLTATAAAVCALRHCRRSQGNYKFDTPFDKTTYGRKAGADGL